MIVRPRRLRQSPTIREMVRETALSPKDFIYPLFVKHGQGEKEPIPSMPGRRKSGTPGSEASTRKVLAPPSALATDVIRSTLIGRFICDRLDSVSAPMAGGLLFSAKARLHVPAGTDTERLREDLERIGDDLMVDLTLVQAVITGKTSR